MRIAILLLVAACELQPSPKKEPAPVVDMNAGSAQPSPPAPSQPPPPAPADAAVADGPPVIEASPACVAVASHVADVFISSATDPTQKAVYEQARPKMIRATGEACTKQGWSEEAQKCYLASKTPAAIKACETKFPARPAPPQTAPQIVPGTTPAEMTPRGQRIRPAHQGSGALP